MFVEEAVFSPSYVLGTFVRNQVGLAVWIPIWVFCPVSLVSVWIDYFQNAVICFHFPFVLVQPPLEKSKIKGQLAEH
jgi:hypothetical protein